MSLQCPYHEKMENDMEKMAGITVSTLTWQAGFEAKLDTIATSLSKTYIIQEDIKECLGDIKIDLAKNYVCKDEFDKLKNSVTSIPWKLLGLNVPLIAVVIVIFQWITNQGG